jgi:hypothetical protein
MEEEDDDDEFTALNSRPILSIVSVNGSWYKK